MSVGRVIDGDTLELRDGRRLRLIGINTPEIGRRGETSEAFAQAARQRLQQLTDVQPLLLSVGENPKDHYGRTLGHLYAADSNIEAQLLREGLGYALAVPPNVDLVECHATAERVAREGSLGVWEGAAFTPASQVSSGGFHIVRGRVQSVSKAGKYYWLELDGPLVLRVAKRDTSYPKAPSVEQLAGNEVEARGWVIERNRGRLKPGHKPFMLPIEHSFMLQRP